MNSAVDTRAGANQPPPYSGVNLFTADPTLGALIEGIPQSLVEELAALGQSLGSSENLELGRIANASPPLLRAFDPGGFRIDVVEFHPAYHALMRRSVAAGLHASIWDASAGEGTVRTVARAARMFMSAQAEAGHLGAMTMTSASVAAMAHAPDIASQWLPRIRCRKYDSSARPMEEKQGVTIGIALTERQGGSDLSGSHMHAEDTGEGTWRIDGRKWFVSAPMSDAFLVLAQTGEGLSCFLVPRFLPDGTQNEIRLLRLKDKLGNRSGATAEAEFDQAFGWQVGEIGRGPQVLADAVTLTRLDGAVVSAGLMRMALAEAVHHARYRRVSGGLLIDRPLMIRVLADMALDVVAAAALTFRLAESFDRADNDPAEAAFARLMTPAAKYWVGKIGPALIAEAMECVGGNGAVEENRLSRLYREAPVQAIRDGPGNVMCLDVLRVLRRTSEPLEAVLATTEDELGTGAKSTLNVLRAAAAVALADEGSARVFTEQLAMTVAAASLRRRFPSVIADAFIESRLGKSWRSTYGMLDSRFDAAGFVDYVCPPV